LATSVKKDWEFDGSINTDGITVSLQFSQEVTKKTTAEIERPVTTVVLYPANMRSMRQLSVRCGCEVASSCVEASPLIMAFNASQIFLDAFLTRFRTLPVP
jgi:hypothetical protein